MLCIRKCDWDSSTTLKIFIPRFLILVTLTDTSATECNAYVDFFLWKYYFFIRFYELSSEFFKVRTKQYAWVDLNIFCQTNCPISAVFYTFSVLHWPMVNSEKHFYVFKIESIFCSFHKTSLHHGGTCQAQSNDRRAVEHHRSAQALRAHIQ